MDLRLRDNQVEILHGGLSDVDQQRVVEDFGNASRPLRLLKLRRRVRGHQLALSVPPAHPLRHAVVADGLPAAERPGRPLRGQERTPHIVYLVTESATETIHEWLAVTYRGARYEGVIPLEELLARTGFGRDEVPNRGRRPDIEALRRLLPNAVAKAREWVAARRRDFEERVNEKLNRELGGLEKLKARRLRQLEWQLDRSDQSETFKRARAERGRRDVDAIFDEYLEWIEDTMTTEPQPYTKVVCAMRGEPARP